MPRQLVCAASMRFYFGALHQKNAQKWFTMMIPRASISAQAGRMKPKFK
jgi:hypothetical protein